MAEESAFPLRYWELVWYSLILVTGALGNLLVGLVICKSSSVFRSNPFNMYICSLAVTDMLLALVVMPNYILSTSTFKHPKGVWGDVMCKTITGDFMTSYFSDVSAYTLILIALERLRAVQKFPATTLSSSSKRWRAWLSIVIVWIIPLAFDSPLAVLLQYKRERRPVIGYHCIFLWTGEPTLHAEIYSSIVVLIFDGLIPVMIFIYSFYHIRKCLVEKEHRVSEGMQRDSFNDGYRYHNSWQMVERRQKTVKVLMITSAVYVVFWIPNKIMFFMVNYMDQEEKYSKFTWNSPVYQIGVLLGLTGSCINPYLYAWQSNEVRRHSKRSLKSLLPKCLDDDFEYRQIENTIQRKETSNISTASATSGVKTEGDTYFTAKSQGSETVPSRTDSYTPILNVAFQVEYGIRSRIPATYETII